MRFLLVDRIDALEPGVRIAARKTVSFEEEWLPRPTAPYPALPAALAIEAVLQAGMWLLRASSGFTRQPVVVSADRVRLGRPVHAGECSVLRGTAHVGNELVVEGERIVCAFLPLDQFVDPAEARAMFEEMRRPKHERMAAP
jgi:3-hydroxymyristoyl/3-hydroxydecanoyl-(acyl carrier protein) dehydratase